MNKKGFIATSLIYSFFLVFCAMIAGYVAINIHNKMLLNRVKDLIREDLVSKKTMADIAVGSHIKMSIKFRDDTGTNTTALDYIVLSKDTSDVTLLSNGIIVSLSTSANNNYSLTNTEISDKLNSVAGSSACIYGTGRIYKSDFDKILNMKDKSVIRELLNVNLYSPFLDSTSGSEKVYYFAYTPTMESAYSDKSISLDTYKTKIRANFISNIGTTEKVGIRLKIYIKNEIEIKGGDGTDLSPYILESRCYS